MFAQRSHRFKVQPFDRLLNNGHALSLPRGVPNIALSAGSVLALLKHRPQRTRLVIAPSAAHFSYKDGYLTRHLLFVSPPRPAMVLVLCASHPPFSG